MSTLISGRLSGGIVQRGARTAVRGVLCGLGGLVAVSLGATPPSEASTTALNAVAVKAPQRIQGTDGRGHLVYSLVLTNVFTAEVKVDSITVRSGGKQLLKLGGDLLSEAIRPFGGGPPSRSLDPSASAVAYLDVPLPRSRTRRTPKRVRNIISYTFPDDAPVKAVIGSRKLVRDLKPSGRQPITIAPPLRGAGWPSANGCCDPSVPHRSTVISAKGKYVAPETFSVDYTRIVKGHVYRDGGTENSDWTGYRAPVVAATPGKVVRIVNDRPDVSPFLGIDDNPTVSKPIHFGGNGVVVRVKPGVFAHYHHLVKGSVRVRKGQRVRVGQRLGALGNSGNTNGPHLHFGINDGPHPLTSHSLPFEIDRFRFQGNAGVGPVPGKLPVTGKPRTFRRVHPLLSSVSKYRR